MIGAFVFILGNLIGSFLNVCIYRIPREQSIVYPPSHCTNCDNSIKWKDLLPIISYILLRGKCKHCKEKISIRYPIIEFITGLLFLSLYLNYGFSFANIKYSVLVCLFIVIGIIDYDTKDVYDNTIITSVIFGGIFIIAEFYMHKAGILGNFNFITYILGGALGGGVILIIILLTGGMGLGDAEICFICGLFLGFKLTALVLILSFIIGGLVGLCLIITKIKSRKDQIPFGPFIVISTLITLFWGQVIIHCYCQILF